ncbi:hypothetical protein HYALB_00004715 [Hymenoscyphus albidus]|uniref:C2H2-type domain-containing protein n=1 Tax=Hymenoscyphus albidus TaxID=595503 RepID=A0A9N9LVR5_9HELO|nr:hypothetical protein HYALB_00004715 [Hymenoscyphus albidus]
MSTENMIKEGPIETTELCDSETKLQCGVPSCSEEREFSTEPQLQKQCKKYSKPHVCSVQGCKHPQFGDKGGLDRHTREVHGSKTYCCLITTCKRHTRGFPRNYNLFDHQQRCHSGQSPRPMLSSLVRNASAEDAQDGIKALISSKLTIGGGRLQEELERLCPLRMEIDSDIEALKRTVDIMGES